MSLRKLIFPSGTVHPLYAQYVGWSCISNALISVETAVATHNMLDAMSSGSDTLRTVNYIGKDVIGQLGGLWFMSKMSYKADKYPKRFLLYSNLVQQMAYMGICATPLAPDYFLPIAGASNLLLNLSFTGFGAINAKCIQGLSASNIGEAYAKISVVNTLGSSLGLLAGLGLTTLGADNGLFHLAVVSITGSLRIYSFNRATRGLL